MMMFAIRTALLFFVMMQGSFGDASAKTVSAGDAIVDLPRGWFSNASVSSDLRASIKASATLCPDRDIEHSPVFFGVHERREFRPDAVDKFERYSRGRGNTVSVVSVDGERMVVSEALDKSDAGRPMVRWMGKVNHLGVTYWMTAGAPERERAKISSTVREILSSWKWKNGQPGAVTRSSKKRGSP